ncbi:hypothetical protein P4O66_014947, partial [Electrophorus voltai]
NRMKGIFSLAGLLLLVTVQSSWQFPAQDIEENSSVKLNTLAFISTQTRRHADGTYTSDVSSYLRDQVAKEFVSWLKTARGRRE